jgi:hypothetical protein
MPHATLAIERDGRFDRGRPRYSAHEERPVRFDGLATRSSDEAPASPSPTTSPASKIRVLPLQNSVTVAPRAICGSVMSDFDYTAPAELFAAHGRSGLRCRRFPNAAEAIQYAVEKLPANLLPNSRLEVRRHHLDSKQILALYESDAFPLVRAAHLRAHSVNA